MSYLVLARKYRPKNFTEIVGQAHIGEVLKNAIEKKRIAHAYIFSGPRGTGKTTTARIFTKALNCKEGPTDKPCDKCVNCQEISDGNSMDVLEIDGASNRGIDEIKALRENARFSPAASNYKIYIIDEAHQITDAAFNALLKTLEEPPEHVVFILATTDAQKIPLTILSRCQRFKFKPLSTTDAANHLEKIAKLEKFNIDKSALRLIAGISNGSLRDSFSMLDQVISFSPDEKITDKTVRDLIGLSPVELVVSFIDLISQKNPKGILEKIAEVAAEGYDFLQVARDLRDYLRKLTFAKYLDLEKNIIDTLLPEEIEALKKHKERFAEHILLRNLHLVNKCIEEMRWSDNPRIIFELYCLKLMQDSASIDELIDKLSQLEKEAGSDEPTPSAIPEKIKTAADFKFEPAPKPAPVKIPVFTPPVTKKADPAPAVSATPLAPESKSTQLGTKWQALMADVKTQKPFLADFLETVQNKKFIGNDIVLYIAPGLYFDTIKGSLDAIETIAKKHFGDTIKIRLEVLQSAKQPIIPEQKKESDVPEVEDNDTEDAEVPDEKGGEVFEVASETKKDPVVSDTVIKKVVDAFHGKIIDKQG
ncbi:MAG: DNA polymerase III, subunit gamma and tau [Elusimicrobia bacterium RIFOXYA2_FULL_39_19]|nr:MAG: DNA polymerase III, subunit gamma and tau [Elusimicrobia bacterium RIFOXYA2_FULL_39_19]